MKEIEVEFPRPCDERWEDMAPSGCNRHCAACDKVIHDLEQMTGEQALALLDSGVEACVRAKVGSDGAIKLKNGPTLGMPSFKRVATGAVASLGVAACAGTPSINETGFAVSGSMSPHKGYGVLELQRKGELIERRPGPRPRGVDRRNYPIYVAYPGKNGEYKFEGVPRGKYTLRYSNCFGKVSLTEVDLDQGDLQLPELIAPKEIEEQFCEIIVGAMYLPRKGSRRP